MHDDTTNDATPEPIDHIAAADGSLVDPASKTQPAEGGIDESEDGGRDAAGGASAGGTGAGDEPS